MKRQGRLLAVLGIILVAINIIAFAIPFPKTVSFWISDVFVILAIMAQILFNYIAYGKADTVRSKVYGFPIVRVGISYLRAVLICACIITIVSSVINQFPTWISVVVYVFLTGAAGIGLIATDHSREIAEHIDETTENDTAFMRKLYREANALTKYSNDPDIRKILVKMAENIRYSDPVSSLALKSQEQLMYSTFQIIREVTQQEDKLKLQTYSELFNKQLVERNSMCKTGKSFSVYE